MYQLRTLFIICIISFAFCNANFAQTMIGVKGQINNFGAPLVVESDNLAKTFKHIINPGFGIAVQRELTEKWGLQLELNYQEERQSYLISGAESRINTSIIKYLRLPILLKRKMDINQWSFQGLMGPNFGYGLELLSSNTSLDYRQFDISRISFTDYQVRRFDLGLLLGLGVEKIVSKSFTTSLSLRYNLGLVDIMKATRNHFYTRGYILEMAIFVPFRNKEID